MWHLETWFSGGLGSAGLVVEFDDLNFVFQIILFYRKNIKENRCR